MSARPFYETIYHVEGWTLADAFRPQPGWGTRRFSVKLADLPEHTEHEFVDMARQAAPERHRLTSVTLYPAEGESRVIWSTPPDGCIRKLCTAASGVSAALTPREVELLREIRVNFGNLDRLSADWRNEARNLLLRIEQGNAGVGSVVPAEPRRSAEEDERIAIMRDRFFDPKPGQLCTFDNMGGWPYQQEAAAKKLTLGAVYAVTKVEVRSAHTRIWLAGQGDGLDDWFNNMMFRPTRGVALPLKGQPE